MMKKINSAVTIVFSVRSKMFRIFSGKGYKSSDFVVVLQLKLLKTECSLSLLSSGIKKKINLNVV